MTCGKPASAGFDLTATWYSVDANGLISYTAVGRQTYRKLFESAGFNFDAIRTLADHQRAISEVVRMKEREFSESAEPLGRYGERGCFFD